MSEMLLEKKSTHKAEVVPVVLEKHPNADALSVVKVYGYECCARTQDWQGITKAVFIVPDSLVDVKRPEFSFLAEQANSEGKARIKAKRLRGVVSYGLLVPAPEGAEIGDDLAEQLGVERYEPPEPSRGANDKFVVSGEEEAGPEGLITGPTKYDIDSFERYHSLLKEGEPTAVVEKLDGMNARFLFWQGRFWVKTRNRWVKRVPNFDHITLESLTSKGVPEEKANEIVSRVKSREPQVNSFWKVLEANTELMKFLEENPGTVVFGEIYGNTNRLKYGLPEGNRFAAFDIYKDGRFLLFSEFHAAVKRAGLEMAPPVGDSYIVKYDFDTIKKLSEGKTAVRDAKAGVIREGVVIRPLDGRYDERFGRVIFKCVNPDFLSHG